MEQQQDQVFNSTWCIVVGAIQSTHNNDIVKHEVENLALKDRLSFPSIWLQQSVKH